ncbi:MAG: hypothetical protein ABEN55_16605, partial [Bradymonadaceae bacterium]
FVYDIFERRRTEILEAISQNPDVARVAGTVDHLFVVEGVEPGRAEFTVRARDADGEIRRDTVSLRVARPRSVHLHPKKAVAFTGRIVNARDPAVGDKKLTVTTGSRIRIGWTRETAGGEPLVGYGVYPIAIQPSGAAKVRERRIQDDNFTLMMPDRPRTFEVVPAGNYRGDSLVVETVESRGDSVAAVAGRDVGGLSDHSIQSRHRANRHVSADLSLVDNLGWGRRIIRIILTVVAVWLTLSLAACLLLLWLVRSPDDDPRQR